MWGLACWFRLLLCDEFGGSGFGMTWFGWLVVVLWLLLMLVRDGWVVGCLGFGFKVHKLR